MDLQKKKQTLRLSVDCQNANLRETVSPQVAKVKKLI